MNKYDYKFLFCNQIYPRVTTLNFGSKSFSIQPRIIDNRAGIDGQPIHYAIDHLYEYLKPDTFPSLTTLDVHGHYGISS